jgi:nucleotide-binding universal stress UspA family protein
VEVDVSKVLAAIDDSAAARPVLAVASALASLYGATVEAVHVSDDEGRTARGSADHLGIQYVCVPGDPLERLAELAAAPDVVAVTAGVRSRPRGRREPGHLTLGLADRVDKPVVVVPPGYQPPDHLRRVLVAMKGEPRNAEALTRVVRLVTSAGLELVVVHVDDEDSIPSFSDAIAHETEGYAREFLMRYCPAAPDASLELRLGVPTDEILAVVEQIAPQLLAIGWPQGFGPARGLVAHELLHRCPIPLLLVAGEPPLLSAGDGASSG